MENGEFEVGIKSHLYHLQMRKLRENKGWTQRELARQAGISFITVHQVETLKIYPTEITAESIADVLDVDTRWLFPQWASSLVEMARSVPTDRAILVTPTMLESREAMLLESEYAPEKQYDKSLLAERTAELVSTLDEREQKILRMRFGIHPETKSHTLEEVGQVFGVSRDRIRQIEAKALKRIAHHHKAEIAAEFIDHQPTESERDRWRQSRKKETSNS